MSLSIFEAIYAQPDTGSELASEREFRRSTRSILKGVVLIRKLFEKNPMLRSLVEKNRLGFIVTSSVGEIEVTRDFLKDFILTDTARPFLFQLSSHNSTVGFLAQYFGLKGPTMTLSNGYQGTEAALESAQLFLSSKSCDAVVVFSVDQSIEEWVDLETYKKFPDLKASSGASLLLVSLEDKLLELTPKAKLIDFTYNKKTSKPVNVGAFYDSNVGEIIAKHVEAKESGAFEYVRPDSTASRFELNVY